MTLRSPARRSLEGVPEGEVAVEAQVLFRQADRDGRASGKAEGQFARGRQQGIGFDQRVEQAEALGQLRDRRALPALEQLAATDHAVVPGWWAVSKEATDAIAAIQAG